MLKLVVDDVEWLEAAVSWK